jgi:UDP-3-O-[3-hydroxymyristoyl] glucosamine N-acyltransferase
MTEISYTLTEIAQRLQLKCVGDSSLHIVGLATLASASKGQMSFLANPRYQKELLNTSATAVIVSEQMADDCPVAALISPNPYLSYAQATELFSIQSSSCSGVHASAVVSGTAQVSSSASIGPHCVIGERAVIGENTVLGAGTFIGDDSVIGANGLLHANVTVYHGVAMGCSAVIHSGTVVGSDGFGFAPHANGWQKIQQLGGVTIGDNVELGANTTIDRGSLDDTLIGNNVIIDNQVQVAHNVQIGDGTAIAGCTAIAGSTRIGKRCTIAGGVGIVGHITLVDGVHITAHTLVTKSITEKGSYSSGTPMQETKQWHKSAVRFTQLNKIAKQLGQLLKMTGLNK